MSKVIDSLRMSVGMYRLRNEIADGIQLYATKSENGWRQLRHKECIKHFLYAAVDKNLENDVIRRGRDWIRKSSLSADKLATNNEYSTKWALPIFVDILSDHTVMVWLNGIVVIRNDDDIKTVTVPDTVLEEILYTGKSALLPVYLIEYSTRMCA